MKIKLNELRKIITEVLLIEGAMSFEDMMGRPAIKPLIDVAKKKYSDFLGTDLDYEQFKQELFNIENQNTVGTVVYRSLFTFFIVDLMSRDEFECNQNSIKSLSDFLQLLKNTKSKAYISRSNFFNSEILTFLSSKGITINPKIMNMPLQDKVLKVYSQYRLLTNSDLIADLLNGTINEKKLEDNKISTFAGYENSFIDQCVKNNYWFPICRELEGQNIKVFYIPNTRGTEINYLSVLHACNVQNDKRPYNELAGDVLRKMSNNQYATGIPHNMYVVVNDNHEYNIRGTTNWCIKEKGMLKRYSGMPGLIFVLNNNKSFDDPEGCLLIGAVKQGNNYFLHPDLAANAHDISTKAPYIKNEYLSKEIKNLLSKPLLNPPGIASQTKVFKLSERDAILARFCNLFKSYTFEAGGFELIECIEEKDLDLSIASMKEIIRNNYSNSENGIKFTQPKMWNLIFLKGTNVLFDQNEDFISTESNENSLSYYDNRQNTKLILPFTKDLNLESSSVDENDLAQFPLNNIKDLVHILKQIKDSKIDKMNYENQLVFLDDRTVERHVEILNDDETQLEETNLRKLIKGYFELLK